MRKIVISFLFLLGAAEIAWATLAAFRYHMMGPEFARAFHVAKLSTEQQQILQQVLQQFEDTVKFDWSFMALFGFVTILIAIYFWATEAAKKRDA